MEGDRMNDESAVELRRYVVSKRLGVLMAAVRALRKAERMLPDDPLNESITDVRFRAEVVLREIRAAASMA